MQISHSFLLVELGLSFQPLQEIYKKYKYLVTNSWMKVLWEKPSLFDMATIIMDTPNFFPRKRDQFITQVLLWGGYNAEAISQLNRVQVSLQLLFMSDVLMALGKRICNIILRHCPYWESCSNMRWPKKQPMASNIMLWSTAMQAICPSWCSMTEVGHFIGQTHHFFAYRFVDTSLFS